MPPIQAFIFDLDGVIADTTDLHYASWKRLAEEEGIPFDRTVNERLRGLTRPASLEIVLRGRKVSAARQEELLARKNRYYLALLQHMTPEDILPGVVPLLEEIRAAGWKLGVGSASRNARAVLHQLGLLDWFDAIADGHSVSRSKPAPDVFLAAARMLEVPPESCVVIEDAPAGIEAARAAGMKVVGVGPEARLGHADARFPSLEGVSLAMILEAIQP